MVRPTVNRVLEVAGRALDGLGGDGQVLVVAERGTTTVTVTAVHDGRAASATTTDTGDAALARAAKAAGVRARRMRALPAPPLPQPRPAPQRERAAPPGAAVADIAVASTTGIRHAERRSHAIVRAARGRAAVTRADGDADRAHAELLALLGEGDAAGPFAPHVPSGPATPAEPADEATLVLGPEAVAALLDRLRPAFGVDAALGAGPAIGDRLAAPGVDLADDAGHPGTLPRAADAEGVPRERVVLIRDGRVAGHVHDSASAHRAGTASTGHATRPLTLAPLPEHLVLEAPATDADVVELCAPVRRGLYVPALTPARETVGAARIRDGRIVGAAGVRELDLDPWAVLAAVTGATGALRLVALTPHCPGGVGAAVVPALRCTP